MADERSKSWEFGDKLYLIDGKQLVVYDGESVKAVEGYIPLLTIAKAPNGGGTDYEALNLLQPKFRERFAGTDADKAYAVPTASGNARFVNGEWVYY